MSEKLTQEEMQFIGFLSMLANSALSQLGKIQNPVTKKVEKDLAGAQMTISLLEMLESKTRNNLTQNEAAVLQDYLTHLRMNFVDEMKEEKK